MSAVRPDAEPSISETLAAAKAYLAAGLSVIPVKADGSKAPALAGWREFATRRPTPAELWEWFGPDAAAVYGIGIPGGPASGNLAELDFENAGAWECWLANVPSDTADYLDELPLVRTPGGGTHLYCRLPEPIAGHKLARDAKGKTLVEVRGDNHQVVAPGSPASCHPTRRPYVFERRGWLDDEAARPTPPLPMNVWVEWCALATSMDETPEPEPVPAGRPGRRGAPNHDPGSGPGTDFNHHGTWEETGLFESGWAWAVGAGDRGYVRRPGKALGQSGTVGIARSRRNGWPLFWCFSTSTQFQPDTPYTRFGVFAALRHKGDFQAAAKALLGMGYGRPREPRCNGKAHRPTVSPTARE